jgi:hypothetical protein
MAYTDALQKASDVPKKKREVSEEEERRRAERREVSTSRSHTINLI